MGNIQLAYFESNTVPVQVEIVSSNDLSRLQVFDHSILKKWTVLWYIMIQLGQFWLSWVPFHFKFAVIKLKVFFYQKNTPSNRLEKDIKIIYFICL